MLDFGFKQSKWRFKILPIFVYVRSLSLARLWWRTVSTSSLPPLLSKRWRPGTHSSSSTLPGKSSDFPLEFYLYPGCRGNIRHVLFSWIGHQFFFMNCASEMASCFNQFCGSGSGSELILKVRIRIQVGKNDPKKVKKSELMYRLMCCSLLLAEGFTSSLDVL
jgi:hypothetical protein